MKILLIFLGVITYILGSFLCILGSFLKNGGIFGNCKISNIFFLVLEFPNNVLG